ncbi:MAG: helix-turn-helix transcriptional regulator [Anaerolineae bacterium]|nr:helix-turn-helix transcriptional regulator [Anaerolineae bacterium]
MKDTWQYDPALTVRRIRQARLDAKLNQADVAAMITLVNKDGKRRQMQQSSYSRIESGDNSPTLDNLLQLANILDVSILWLLGISEPTLDDEESQLLEAFRQIPDGTLRDHALDLVVSFSARVKEYYENEDD